MTTLTTHLEHEGTSYPAQHAEILGTRLGWHEHTGCLGVALHLRNDDGTEARSALDDYALDNPPDPSRPPAERRRTADADSMEFVLAIMRTVGVQTWEALVGARVVNVCDPAGTAGWGGRSVGIASADGKRVLIPGRWIEAALARRAPAAERSGCFT